MIKSEHVENSEENNEVLTYLKEYKNIEKYMELVKVDNPIERWAEKTNRHRDSPLKIFFFFCAFLAATLGRIRIRLRHKEQQGPDLRKTPPS